MTTIESQPLAPIYSTLAGDPMLGELVAMYVSEMPNRIADLEAGFSSGDYDRLRRSAHQMKGAAGSYGFDCVTQAAAALESVVRADRPEEEIRRSLGELLQLCRRISADASN